MRLLLKGEGRTAALGTQTCYQSVSIGFASILETQPGAVFLGCLFLVGLCRVAPDGGGPTYWLSELGWPPAGEVAFPGPWSKGKVLLL